MKHGDVTEKKEKNIYVVLKIDLFVQIEKESLSDCFCIVESIWLAKMSWDIELDDQLLQDLYSWIDQIPLSRPKKRIEKDFADGGR